MKTYVVRYYTWGLRIQVRGEFKIAAESVQDALDACAARWPDMVVTSCQECGRAVKP